MKQLSWQDITVQQFQDIHRLSLATNLDDLDKLSRIICILFDKDENKIDDMSMAEYKELARQCAFVMSGTIPGQPVRCIRIGRERYRITYDPTKLRHRQYVEVITFGEKPIENMHLVMASLVERVTWYGKRIKNAAEDHQLLASKLLHARVIDVYHACVFFCKLFTSLINSIADFSTMEMIKQGMTKDQATALSTALKSVTDGFTQPLRLPGFRAYL